MMNFFFYLMITFGCLYALPQEPETGYLFSVQETGKKTRLLLLPSSIDTTISLDNNLLRLDRDTLIGAVVSKETQFQATWENPLSSAKQTIQVAAIRYVPDPGKWSIDGFIDNKPFFIELPVQFENKKIISAYRGSATSIKIISTLRLNRVTSK